MPGSKDKGKGKAVAAPKESKAARCDKINEDIEKLKLRKDRQKRKCDEVYQRYVHQYEKYGKHAAKKYGKELQDEHDELDKISDRIEKKKAEYNAVLHERDSSSDGSHRSKSSERSRRSGSSKSSAPPFVSWACGNCGGMVWGDPEDGFHDQCGTPGCGHQYCTHQVIRNVHVGNSNGRPVYRQVAGQHCEPQFDASAERPH